MFSETDGQTDFLIYIFSYIRVFFFLLSLCLRSESMLTTCMRICEMDIIWSLCWRCCLVTHWWVLLNDHFLSSVSCLCLKHTEKCVKRLSSLEAEYLNMCAVTRCNITVFLKGAIHTSPHLCVCVCVCVTNPAVTHTLISFAKSDLTSTCTFMLYSS